MTDAVAEAAAGGPTRRRRAMPGRLGRLVRATDPASGQPEGRAGGRVERPPAGAAEGRAAQGRGPLLPDPDLRGPKVLLGLVWATGTMIAVLLAPTLLALWMAPVAAAAAAQAARTWRRAPGGRRPSPQAAFAAAGLVVLAAPFGAGALIGGALLAAVGAAAWATTESTRRAGDAASGADVVLTLACAAVPAVAAAGPIVLRSHGLVAALVLVTYALVYDAASWVIGSGSRHRWIGPVAGVACIGSITLGVGSMLPQFKGGSAWELGVLAAVLAPLSPMAASLVLGDRRARVPALRRLDSLVLLSPIWAVAAAHFGV